MQRKITDSDLRNAAMAVGNHYLLTNTPFPVRLTHYEGEQNQIDILAEGRLPPSDKGVAFVVAHLVQLPEGHPLKLLYADMYNVQFKEPDTTPGTRDHRARVYAQRLELDKNETPPHPTDIHCYDFFALDSRVRGQFAQQTRVWLSWAYATRREYEKFIITVLKAMTGNVPMKKEIYFVEVTVAMMLEVAHNTEFASAEETAAKMAEIADLAVTAPDEEVADHVDA